MLRVSVQKELPGFRLDVAFDARENVLVLFGPSGAGKSLTLQCIAGLVTPDRGSLQLRDRTLFDSERGVNLPARRRRIGVVFQQYALFPHLSVTQNVGFGLRHLTRNERAGRVEEMLRTVRLEGLGGRRPRDLSGGQQQRVALARALAPQPDLLLLDEPFASLDEPLRDELRWELLALLAQLGTPAVMVTHNLDEANALGREVAVYDAGRVLQFGPAEQVTQRPHSRRVAELVGIKNVLPGTVVRVSDCWTEVAGAGLTLWGPAGAAAAGEPVDCCVRSEAVALAALPDAESGAAPGTARLPGTITEHVSYGSSVAVVVRLDARSAGSAPPQLHALLSPREFRRLGKRCGERCLAVVEAEDVHLIRTTPSAR